MRLLLIIICSIIISSSLIFVSSTFAQTTGVDVAFTRDVTDPEAVNGDIVEMTEEGLIRISTPYSTKVYGIIQTDSLLVFRKVATDSGQPIARSGIVAVNVTTLSGDIKSGDYITTSSIAGKGQKAIRPGYVIGTAIEDFNTEGAETVEFEGSQYASGSILVALKPDFAGVNAGSSGRLLDQLSSQVFQNLDDTESFGRLLRYVIGGLVILVGLLIGFIIFARSIPKSIEAIGRNPLAKSQIQLSIMLNILMVVVTALLGIGAAFLIIRL